MSATLDDLLAELRAIRAVLEKRPAVTSAPTSQARDLSDEPIPQPDKIHGAAGSVRVHFGKNSGVQLSALAERSLAFYAKKQEPRLRNDGSPFPDRPEDSELRNAARTLWHINRGTLAGEIPKVAAPTDTETRTFMKGDGLDEDVPF